MTTPAAGTIAMSQLLTECGYAANANVNLNHAAFNCLRASAATPISLNQFYNKTNCDVTAGLAGNELGFRNAAGVVGSCAFPNVLGLTLVQLENNTAVNNFTIGFLGNLPDAGWTSVSIVPQAAPGAFVSILRVNRTGFSYNSTFNMTVWEYTAASTILLVNGTRYIVVFQ